MLEQLVLKVGLGIGLGVVAAILSKWSTAEAWDNKKFAFSIVTGVLSALTFLNDSGDVSETNILGLIVTNLGGQFLFNKGVAVVARLRGK